MRRSLALSLHRLIAGQGGRPPVPAARPARPDGALVWLHSGGPDGTGAMAQIARRLREERTPATILVTAEGLTAPDMSGFPDAVLADAAPADRVAAVGAFLDHWAPDVLVVCGSVLAPTLVAEAAERGTGMILSDFRAERAGTGGALFGRSIVKSLLPAFARILVPDAEAALQARTLAGTDAPVSVAGQIEDTADPLGCNEAERQALAEALGTRPVWCAADCPLSEADAVLQAHETALRMAHRMALVLVPADPQDGPEFAARCSDHGHSVALRSHDDEIDDDVQVLVADTEGEYGLWYRLAPVTYMGGSLSGDSDGRSPLEPAALGSAVIAGPKTRGHAVPYARLAEARALRLVRSPQALSEAVADLIAPDRAALLAHNAWAASSGGAEAANAVVEAVQDVLARRAAAHGVTA